MQFDFFAAADAPQPPITLTAHSSPNYSPRTGENARGADVTVAFATDFTTAGERLTHRVAGKNYVGIAFGTDPEMAADLLLQFMASKEATSLNVAGNGIYTLGKSRVTQQAANQWVFDVLSRVAQSRKLTHIRSGGQTGIDTAGLVAGIALGIPVTGLYPKGFKQRLANQTDVSREHHELLEELQAAAAQLHR